MKLYNYDFYKMIFDKIYIAYLFNLKKIEMMND